MGKQQVPMPLAGAQNPKSNTTSGSITPSNKPTQTAQAAAQNVPQGRGATGGAGVIAGAGSSGRRVTNGQRRSYR